MKKGIVIKAVLVVLLTVFFLAFITGCSGSVQEETADSSAVAEKRTSQTESEMEPALSTEDKTESVAETASPTKAKTKKKTETASQTKAKTKKETETASQTESKAENASEDTRDVRQAEISFVDEEGKSYTVDFRPELRQHSYKWKNLTTKSGLKYYEDDKYVTRAGLDLSKYQSNVDWKKIKNAGIEFVILRIGYRGYGEAGQLGIDERFEQHMKNAREAGLDVGVYFFSQAITEQEAAEEAQLVIKQLDGRKLQCPVFFDPEKIKNNKARTDGVSGKQFTKNCKAFCDLIEKAGYDAMVYSDMVWETMELDLAQIEDYGIWYADYETVPQTPYDFEYWQYTRTGRIDGIDGSVDIDLQFIQK